MNQITSKKWDSMTLLNQVNLISKHFTSPQFAQLYNKPVTVLPGVNTLVLLRTCRTATLEVLENYDTGTVYRIRQTGVVIRINSDSSEYIYPSLETYLLTPIQGSLIFKFPSKEIVYTLHQKGYLNKIKRHKNPRFTGTIEFSDNQVLDGQTGIHINIADLSWIDPAPKNSKEIDTLIKKTILFIRANYPAEIAKSQITSPLQGEGFYRLEEPNVDVNYGHSGTGKSHSVDNAEPKHFPKPFNPSKEDLKNAAQTLAKYFSPNKILTDPDTGEHLARGERDTTPDQDNP